MIRVRRSCVLVLLAVWSQGCSSSGLKWAESLGTQLECGMPTSEISELAVPSARLDPYEHAWLGDHKLQKGRTTLWITTSSAGLEAYRIATDELRKLKSVRLSMRRNVCTGETTIAVHLLTRRELVGAEVFVDGVLAGQVDGLMSTRLEIPPGTHEIRLEKEGYPPLVRVVSYSGATTRGEQRLDLSTATLGET